MTLPPYSRAGRGQLDRGQAARMQGDLERMSQLGGVGRIGFGHAGGGTQLLDTRPVEFWATLNAQPNPNSNAYGFIAVDDGRGDGTYPVLTGTTAIADGASLVAWEANGRTDVPINGSVRVWMQPNRMGPGYTFT